MVKDEINNEQIDLGKLCELVEQQIADDNYQEVSKTLEQLIALVPDEAGFYYCKGFVLHNHLDQIVESVPYYSKAIELRPEDETLYAELGYAYISLNKYHHALDIFTKLVSVNPKVLDGWFGRVNSYNNLGRYREAISSIEPLLTIITNDNSNSSDQNNQCKYYEVLLIKSRLLIKLEQYQEALELVESCIARDADNISVWRHKGYVLSQLRNYEQAIDCYNKALEIITKQQLAEELNLESIESKVSEVSTNSAIELNPNVILNRDSKLNNSINWQEIVHGVLLEKVGCLRDLKCYKEAEEIISSMLQLDPTDMVAVNYQAGLYISQEQYNKALEIIEQVIEQLPNSSSAYLTKIIAHYFSKDYQASIDCAELAMRKDIIDHHDLLVTLDYLAESHLRLTNYQEAIEYSDQLLAAIANTGVDISKASSTSDMLSLYKSSTECKALSLLKLGRIKEATSLTNKLYELDPHYGYVLVIKARLLNLEGKYQEAIAIAEQLLEMDVEYSYPLHCKAVAFFHLNKYSESISCFAKSFSMTLVPLNPLQKTRYQEAVSYLQKIIDISSSNRNIADLAKAKKVINIALEQMQG